MSYKLFGLMISCFIIGSLGCKQNNSSAVKTKEAQETAAASNESITYDGST